MDNDIQTNNSLTPDCFVVVRDEADKALTYFEQAELDNNLIGLEKLKTPTELADKKYADFIDDTPVAGNVYIFSDFTHKYIKADNNDEILKDAALRCGKFLDFCRCVGVKSVHYVSDESNRVDDSIKMDGQVKVGVKKVDAELGGSAEKSSTSKKKSGVDYSFDAETIGEYDADNVENDYKANGWWRFSEFSQLYNHWKQKNGGSLKIKLNYYLEESQRRSFAFKIATAISGICDIKVDCHFQKDVEIENALNREIEVEFFPLSEYCKSKRTAVVKNPLEGKKKKNICLWISIAVAAFIAGAILCLCLIKLV
ncbi:MAG: hypothetical protein MJ033_07935 [Victivallaceae bacterium]|nr:hypothetical protein [Victivallaceae bacterium]